MSSDRTNSRPLKPTLAPNRSARAPLAPRIGANASPAPAIRAVAPRVAARTPVSSPRPSAQDDGALKDPAGSSNITPRSTARKLRAESVQSSPAQEDNIGVGRPRTLAASSSAPAERGAGGGGGGVSSGLSVNSGSQSFSRDSRSTSIVSDNGPAKLSPMLPRSAGYLDGTHSGLSDRVDDRFFLASDLQKQEPVPKRPEPKKPPAFFYADGKEDRPPSPPIPSPAASAVSEQYFSSQRARLDGRLNPMAKSTPMLSPALSSIAATSPYFLATNAAPTEVRSPSPSKENIHLSYRKGASQIFGIRPSPRSVVSSTSGIPTIKTTGSLSTSGQQRPSFSGSHRKSSSVSSIDSGNSYQARRRSATVIDVVPPAAVENEEDASTNGTRLTNMSINLPTIDTSLASSMEPRSPPEGTLSPTKAVSELAAEARRERKVLDLEISNSSLLAINASLEREVRRQKAELKRFRRLSRAGRFSFGSNERSARFSEGLSTLGEENDEDDEDMTATDSLPGFAEDYSDSDDDGSLGSESEPLSPEAETQRNQDRLAKDEKRLRVDLARHKELLVQSQMMNQSLKRCMYATEEMIKEGKKALLYHVRVSDVKLGGRVLTGHEDEEDHTGVEIVDDSNNNDDDNDAFSQAQQSMESANALLDVWKGVGRPFFEGSEASADRDSGIEVDNPLSHVAIGQPDVIQPPKLVSNHQDLHADLAKLEADHQ